MERPPGSRASALTSAAVLAALLLGACGKETKPSEEGVRAYGFPKRYDTERIPVGPLLGETPRVPSATPPEGGSSSPAPSPRAPLAPSPAASLPPSPRAPASSASTTYKVVPVEKGGTIRGFCRVSSPPSARAQVVVFKHQDLGCGHGHDSERAVWRDSDRALANCVVSLRSVKEGKDFPEDLRPEARECFVDQKTCMYHPHVSWTRPSTQLAFGNQDAAEHNVHGYRVTGVNAETTFNVPIKPGGREAEIESAFLERPGLYALKCDIHPWMSGYVHVLAHPYADVTSAEDDPARGRKAGEFVLDGVPEGEFEVVCWHEGMVGTPVVVDGLIKDTTYSPNQEVSRPVRVAPGQTLVLDDFVLPYK